MNTSFRRSNDVRAHRFFHASPATHRVKRRTGLTKAARYALTSERGRGVLPVVKERFIERRQIQTILSTDVFGPAPHSLFERSRPLVLNFYGIRTVTSKREHFNSQMNPGLRKNTFVVRLKNNWLIQYLILKRASCMDRV